MKGQYPDQNRKGSGSKKRQNTGLHGDGTNPPFPLQIRIEEDHYNGTELKMIMTTDQDQRLRKTQSYIEMHLLTN